jgi:hypothetical protein
MEQPRVGRNQARRNKWALQAMRNLLSAKPLPITWTDKPGQGEVILAGTADAPTLEAAVRLMVKLIRVLGDGQPGRWHEDPRISLEPTPRGGICRMSWLWIGPARTFGVHDFTGPPVTEPPWRCSLKAEISVTAGPVN